ncbi:MAG: archaellin/type IV pilin N-terminal domain-containing protein [Candidatus Bathyarchaeia archaeon]
MKILKSKKALSPVVAAIILIAVTVAVSLAVAIWMGALTTGFMATEQLSFIDCTYANDLSYVDLTLKNTGSGSLTISKILINGYLNTTNPGWTVQTSGADATLTPNEVVVIRVSASGYPVSAGIVSGKFDRGANYAFTVITSKNNQFGPYTKAASP